MKIPHTPDSMTKGFSLIELLLCVTIVGILAAILIPVYSTIRNRADTAKCGSQMRGMAPAFTAYATDNNGYYPAPRYNTSSDASYAPTNKKGHWEVEIQDYVGFNIRQTLSHDGLQTLAICPVGQTGMNSKLTNRTIPDGSSAIDYQTPVVLINDPSNTVLLGDSDHYHHGIWENMEPTEEGKFKGGDPVRHQGKANYLVVDGHLEFLPLDQALEAVTRGKKQ